MAGEWIGVFEGEVDLKVDEYADKKGKVDSWRMIGDILSANRSPLGAVPVFISAYAADRGAQIITILRETQVYEKYWKWLYG